MKRMWKALVTGVAGVIAVVVVMAASVQAQVPKSGKLAFHNPGHYRAAYLKTGEKASGTAGDWFSVLVPKGDSKFLAFRNNTCLYA
jgi:predicted transcriptional regulator of viral defense system